MDKVEAEVKEIKDSSDLIIYSHRETHFRAKKHQIRKSREFKNPFMNASKKRRNANSQRNTRVDKSHHSPRAFGPKVKLSKMAFNEPEEKSSNFFQMNSFQTDQFPVRRFPILRKIREKKKMKMKNVLKSKKKKFKKIIGKKSLSLKEFENLDLSNYPKHEFIHRRVNSELLGDKWVNYDSQQEIEKKRIIYREILKELRSRKFLTKKLLREICFGKNNEYDDKLLRFCIYKRLENFNYFKKGK